MANGTDPLAGVRTTAYRGRQRQVQDSDRAMQDRANHLVRIEKRDGGLILAVVVLSCSLAASLIGNVVQGLTGVRTEPYVMLLDQLANERPLMRVSELPVTPDQSQVIGVLMNWTEWVRTISNDPVVLGKAWEHVEDYTSNTALNQLADYRREQKLRLQLGRRVEVSKVNVLPIGNSRSYTVEWDEKTVDQSGRLVPEECAHWKATVSIADFHSQAAKQERELRRQQRRYRNILGIVVDDVHWQSRPLYLNGVIPNEAR